jgi:pyridoxamine 5'-phosphate oxidase
MINADPFERFGELFEHVSSLGIPEHNAMCLSTVDASGRPSSRMVLLKGFDERGFVFYTNLESRKGRELRGNPAVALCFFWQQIARQVRIEGDAVAVSDREADAYFASRPRGSQIGAWASAQSQPLSGRDELVTKVEEMEKRFEGVEVPRPPHWSGFRVVPRRIEFWTGEQFRLHERDIYERNADGVWGRSLLYP